MDYNPIFLLAKEFDINIDDIFIKKLQLFERVIIDMINNGKDSICGKEQKEKCKIQYGNNLDWACKNCKKNPKNRLNNGK